ncbi:hypothetical protein EKD04_000185 [Chloroflexales bacterium ZM16-3]|nr:hypothetical protein [Chloroflexales bacterium ZM16-3]
MKIAIVSNNGTTISRHFGRAHQYVIVSIEDGQETARELRAKSNCHGHEHGHDHGHDHEHGHANPEHDTMLAEIADCDVVIVGGMGAGMDQRLRSGGKKAIRTQTQTVNLAVTQFLNGQLTDMIELVH